MAQLLLQIVAIVLSRLCAASVIVLILLPFSAPFPTCPLGQVPLRSSAAHGPLPQHDQPTLVDRSGTPGLTARITVKALRFLTAAAGQRALSAEPRPSSDIRPHTTAHVRPLDQFPALRI